MATSGRYEDAPSQRKFDPDYKPREGTMEDDRRALENTVMRERDDRSPAAKAFHTVQQDLSDLETVLMELAQRLQPALTPGFHGDRGAADVPCETSEEGSLLVEELHSFSRQIRDKIETVQILTKRLEL